MARDSRTGKYKSAPVDHGPYTYRNNAGRIIGQVWQTPYGW